MKQVRSAGAIVFVLCIAVLGAALPAVAQETPGQASAEFEVKRMVLATGVENREPVGETEMFSKTDATAYVFLEATAIASDTEVTFAWYHGDAEVAAVTVPLKQGGRWRTYASKQLGGLTGDWRVELKDAAGNTLKTLTFTVQ